MAITMLTLVVIFTSCVAVTNSTSQGTVQCSSTTRFSVLTERIIRVEYSETGEFEDRPTLVFPHRGWQSPPIPTFTVHNATVWCNISTSQVQVSFNKGTPSPPITRTVRIGARLSPPETCGAVEVLENHDARCRFSTAPRCHRTAKHPVGVANQTQASCCALCDSDPECGVWVWHSITDKDCYLLTNDSVIGTVEVKGHVLGSKKPIVPSPPPPSPPPTPGPDPAWKHFFSSHLLQAKGLMQQWKWSVDDNTSANLLGTLAPTPSADLAGCCHNPNASAGIYDPKYALEDGLISRDGWSIIDDSVTSLMTFAADAKHLEDGWISSASRIKGNSDIYILGCGREYRQCLQEYTSIAGSVALPPLSGLGVWWSRHWGDESGNKQMVDAVGVMSEQAITTQVLEGYESRGLPLHVLVLDMEWHEMNQAPKCQMFMGKTVWGGYSWNKTLFSDQNKFVQKLHNSRGPQGIKLSLNFHPDSGVDNCQNNYDEMGKALGLDTSNLAPLPDMDSISSSFNQTYVEAYFKYMIDPTNVDFSWTDTPQATTWTNWLYVMMPAKKNKRVINFSRYGGLGNHRSPIGFSGDTLRRWDTLEYEVWFTPRASNVGFAWWSHDIGGFAGDFIDSDWHTEEPELFLRWLQFGGFSPILRTHCRYCDQRIWTWEKYDSATVTWYPMMKEVMLTRNSLVPYIYTHAFHRTFGTGEGLLTPMYWDGNASHLEQAYAIANQHQYFFGREFVVAPITTPVNSIDNTTLKTVWLPPSSQPWYDFATTSAVVGGDASGTAVTRTYGLSEVPLFVRGGAVVPTRDMTSAYKIVSDPLIWMLIPGTSGIGQVYEDAGDTMDFRDGQGITTTLSFNASINNRVRVTTAPLVSIAVTISPAVGEMVGAPTHRQQRVWLRGSQALPASALCDGQQLHQTNATSTEQGFWLEPEGLVVACGNVTLMSPHTIIATFSE